MFNANHATLTAVHMDILNMTGEADNWHGIYYDGITSKKIIQ